MIVRRVHRMPFGAQLEEDVTRFALFAPDVPDVRAIVGETPHVMQAKADGWRELRVPGSHPDTRYIFDLGEIRVPDPASRYQPDGVHQPSAIVDPLAFSWSDTDWRG